MDQEISHWLPCPLSQITTRILEISALPFTVLQARLAPARSVIQRIVTSSSDKGNPPSFLLHVFSHGGCNTAIQLALSLRNDPIHPVELAVWTRGIIFDCCPGDATFGRAYEAAAHSLPRAEPAQSVGKIILYPIVSLITGLQQAGLMSSVHNLRAQLNDPAVFGAVARRLYLYSTADQVVGWEGVESHMEEARAQLGCLVEGVSFTNSPHCAIVRDHPERYWGAVEQFWERDTVGSASADTRRSRL